MSKTGDTTVEDELRIITNRIPREVLDSFELTTAEREEFDYLDWAALDAGEDSASFIRYHGSTYDLGEFQTTSGMPEFSPLRQWDGYLSDSFFSGLVVKFVDDCERVIVGRYVA
jgi:hypothetical protein